MERLVPGRREVGLEAVSRLGDVREMRQPLEDDHSAGDERLLGVAARVLRSEPV